MRLADRAGGAAYLLTEALYLCGRRGNVPAPQVHERAAAVWNLNHRRSAGDGCAGPRLGDGGVDSAPPVKRTPVVPNRHHRGGANLAPPRSPSPGTAGGVNLPPPYEDSAVQTLGGRTGAPPAARAICPRGPSQSPSTKPATCPRSSKHARKPRRRARSSARSLPGSRGSTWRCTSVFSGTGARARLPLG